MAGVDLNKLFGVCRGQAEGLDEFDLEAERDGRAIGKFRSDFSLARAATRASMKRKVLRGSLGASDRKGLVSVPPRS